MIGKLKNNYLIIIILFFSFLSKTILLGSFPTGISNDELHFVLNAKSVYYRFSDIAHSGWNPLTLSTIPRETSSELPFLILAPLIGPLPTNLFTARLPLAILGTIFTYLIYLITLRLFKSKPISLLSALISVLNPWAFYVFRTSFDAPIALTFFLWGIYLVLRYSDSHSVYSLLPFTIAFYTYIGTKLIFIPIIFATVYFSYHRLKLSKKSALLICFVSLIIFSFYLIKTFSSHEVRLGELITPHSPIIVNEVIQNRTASVSSPLTPLINNRYVIFLKFIITKYLTNFSPDLFFLTGDHTFMVSLWQHGYFYYLDALLLFIGIVYLFSRYPYAFFYLVFLIALSPLPEALRSDKIPAYAFHSCFQYPFIYIFIASGIYYLWTLKNKYIFLFLLTIQTIQIFNLVDIYFNRYPVYQPEAFTFSRQVLSQYLWLSSPLVQNIYVITSDPDSTFRNYIFYQNLLNKSSIDNISSQYRQFPNRNYFRLGNIVFTNDINHTPRQDAPTDIYILQKSLSQRAPHEPSKFINLLNTTDTLYTISNDKLCPQAPTTNGLPLQTWQFSISRLSPPQFCQLYISPDSH
ncbi:MAG: hypothetical protein WAV41_04810 [Microgenomates group bacterium]